MVLKYFIICLLGIITIQGVSAALEDDLISYYKLDNNDLSSETGSTTLVEGGVNTVNITGKIIDARYFNTSAAWLDLDDNASLGDNTITGNNSFSFNGWVYIGNTTQYSIIFAQAGTTAQNKYILIDISGATAGRPRCIIYNNGTEVAINSSTSLSNNTWHMITCTHDSESNVTTLYIDSTSVSSITKYVQRNASTTASAELGHRPGSFYLNSRMDEIGFWKGKAISQGEINILYNSGSGCSYFDATCWSAHTIELNFTPTTNGTINWQPPNINEDCCTDNFSGTSLSITAERFTEGNRVTIVFNEQNSTNLSAEADVSQYYEFINTFEDVNEKIGVFGTMNRVVWINTYDYGNRRIYDATVRLTVYPDDNLTNGYTVSQRLTRPFTGGATPGTPVYLASNLTYWITASKEGYLCEPTIWLGRDFENNLELNIRCRVLTNSELSEYLIIGPKTYTNGTSAIGYGISYTPGGNTYWNTSESTALNTVVLENGGGNALLINGTHYTEGNNITIEVYSRNETTGIYTLENSFTTIFSTATVYAPINEIDRDNNILGALVFIGIIIISTIVGAMIKINQTEGSGYYIFSGLAILSVGLSTALLAVAIVVALTAIGDLLFSSTRD